MLGRHRALKTTFSTDVHATESEKEVALEALPHFTQIFTGWLSTRDNGTAATPINDPFGTPSRLAGDISGKSLSHKGAELLRMGYEDAP